MTDLQSHTPFPLTLNTIFNDSPLFRRDYPSAEQRHRLSSRRNSGPLDETIAPTLVGSIARKTQAFSPTSLGEFYRPSSDDASLLESSRRAAGRGHPQCGQPTTGQTTDHWD